MKNKLSNIITLLLVANGNKEWKFSEPITIDHGFRKIEIFGLSVSPKNELFAMTVDSIGGKPETYWHKVEVSDTGAEKIIDAIHVRVLKHQMQAA
jgi:hypothetical protein